MKKLKRAPSVYIIEDDPKLETQQSESQPQAPASSGNRRQKLLIRIGLLLPLVLLAITLARGAAEKKQLPDSILGVWVTSNPEYAHCYMEITPATVVFGNAQNGYLLYFVSSYEEFNDSGRTTYVVHYTDLDGMKYQMSIVHTSGPREMVYFSHNPSVGWTRRPSQ
jgi:hypothetical protein